MPDSMLVAIAYDTPSDARRRRICRLLEDVGVRVQWSVFEGWLTEAEADDVWHQLEGMIDPDADRLRLYRACSYCRDASRTAGLAHATAVPEFWIA